MKPTDALALLSTSTEAFHWACSTQCVELVDMMVMNGAVLTPDCTDALVQAVRGNNVPVVEYLLSKGVLAMRGKSGPSVLFSAISINNVNYDILTLIAEQDNGLPRDHEYNVSRPYLFGEALEYAVRWKKEELAVWLLHHKPDLTTSFAFGLALTNNDHVMSRLLLSHGASMYQCAGYDKTPIEIVANQPDGFKLFIENGASVTSIKGRVPENLLYALYGSPKGALSKMPVKASSSFKQLMVDRHVAHSVRDALTLMSHAPETLRRYYMTWVGADIR